MEFFSINLGTDFSAVVAPDLGKDLDKKGKPTTILKPTTVVRPKPTINVVR